MSGLQVVDEFFDAVEKGDFVRMRELYAPDAVIWHNDGEGEQSADDNVAGMAALHAVVRRLRYDVARRASTDDGGVFVQHVLRGELPNGEALALDAAMYITLGQETIVRIDEYFDTAVVKDAYAVIAGSTKDA
jgi:ketosteroid isomerase-like protein